MLALQPAWPYGQRPVEMLFQVRPRRDSNSRTWFRKPMLYPLSYEGRRPGTNVSGFGTVLPRRR